MKKQRRRPKLNVTYSVLWRFRSQVEQRGDDECWPWKGSVTSRGYGTFGASGRQWGAHVVAFILYKGDVPAGLEIRHTCEGRYPIGDNGARICCNPAHLLAGTRLENMRDKITSGRIYAGDRHHKRLAAARKAG